MSADYAIVVDPDRDLLRITLSGFFDPADLDGFDEARHTAYGRLRCGPNRHATLVDVRDLRIQAQAVFDLFRAMIADPATRARRLAFVTGDAAVRLQVRRIVDNDDMQCFSDMAQAEAWLTEPPARYALAG